ncbi:hypothetical protein [Streptomyces sp. CBMA156]|uniref:hypothetical protein n=1 Tax=Streptomyces sp. CBMA156 TaxID=1930280 RepID=UPI00166196C8|nr:hypothetical protein [Streptomyces sp. CBMA156]MBD0671802.1 hypothetical protein [Streptomyces sp. CBMA156]
MGARTIAARLHGTPAPGVPRWAVLTGYAITLAVLPSCLWRIGGFVLGLPLLHHSPTPPDQDPASFDGGWAYILALSVVSEALALLCFGLVARWGEVWPRRIPVLGGRPVPVLAAVIPAGLGSAALMVFPYAMVMFSLGLTIRGDRGGVVTHGWQTVVFWICYLPLAAWGPLLAVLTVHYYRRRRAS